jgi:hypothetical protein
MEQEPKSVKEIVDSASWTALDPRVRVVRADVFERYLTAERERYELRESDVNPIVNLNVN